MLYFECVYRVILTCALLLSWADPSPAAVEGLHLHGIAAVTKQLGKNPLSISCEETNNWMSTRQAAYFSNTGQVWRRVRSALIRGASRMYGLPPPAPSLAAPHLCWSSGSQLKTVIYAWGFVQRSLITHSHFKNQQIITVYIIDLMGPRRFTLFYRTVI